MKTAVLIVNYNTRDDLRACLNSLLATGCPPESIWVADNASTDGSWEMVQAEFPRVRTVRNSRNLYYAAATNQLWNRSESDWTLLLNPDVVCHFKDLLTLAEKWDADSRCAAVAPQLRYFDGRVQRSCRRLPDALTVWREGWSTLTGQPSLWKMGDFDHRSPRSVPQPMFSCLWIRRSSWQRVGELDSRYPLFFNDVDWCRRALASSHEIQFDPSVSVLHRVGGSTSRNPVGSLLRSNLAFAQYLGAESKSWTGKLVGLLGLALALACRLPRAVLQTRHE
jgi:GT2 family glycosyltransferase